VDSAINQVVGGAVSALDTLNEIASAINNDSALTTTLNSLINDKANTATIASLNSVVLLKANQTSITQLVSTVGTKANNISYSRPMSRMYKLSARQRMHHGSDSE
jgi:hypothetical protein